MWVEQTERFEDQRWFLFLFYIGTTVHIKTMSSSETRPNCEELRDELAKVIARNYSTYEVNSNRINSLLAKAKLYSDEKDEQLRVFSDDLLRVVVVFLHASLEEILRAVALAHLPGCGEDVLNRVPLAGSIDSLRPEKFFLGRLKGHRDKTVEELIRLSVEEHMLRRSFSDTSEIVGFLTATGFTIDDSLRSKLAAIEGLMARRHLIVHRADIAPGNDKPSEISYEMVQEWAKASTHFKAYITTLDMFKSVPALADLPKKNRVAKSDTQGEP